MSATSPNCGSLLKRGVAWLPAGASHVAAFAGAPATELFAEATGAAVPDVAVLTPLPARGGGGRRNGVASNLLLAAKPPTPAPVSVPDAARPPARGGDFAGVGGATRSPFAGHGSGENVPDLLPSNLSLLPERLARGESSALAPPPHLLQTTHGTSGSPTAGHSIPHLCRNCTCGRRYRTARGAANDRSELSRAPASARHVPVHWNELFQEILRVVAHNEATDDVVLLIKHGEIRRPFAQVIHQLLNVLRYLRLFGACEVCGASGARQSTGDAGAGADIIGTSGLQSHVADKAQLVFELFQLADTSLAQRERATLVTVVFAPISSLRCRAIVADGEVEAYVEDGRTI
eukprot:CAMPEP_0183507242 /NCGR_PEP_ID=MMETSP0371-20130417/8078_1 /TAXON_ID=268820 /ORGANISM="Peridinium aciculiferum, Strain PAER-2" /LENGTH=346 /DNA_ID=CAMNT_0025703413 /DNA_START=129 /DNA_END=1171 /DNA_ORIENTATION=+